MINIHDIIYKLYPQVKVIRGNESFDISNNPVNINLSTVQFEFEKLAKLDEINAAFESAIFSIKNGYPSDEISSWSKQETEARAYQASNTAATPLLDALATSRGITKAELATRIITKADLFATASGHLIGKRQGLEDRLNALPINATAADVSTIIW
jgi:hypothetical protein